MILLSGAKGAVITTSLIWFTAEVTPQSITFLALTLNTIGLPSGRLKGMTVKMV